MLCWLSASVYKKEGLKINQRFVENPNLPEGNVSLMVIDGRINRELEEALLKRNIKLIKTKKLQGTYDAISYHPDIMLHHLGGKDIIVAPNIDDCMVYDLEEEGFNIIIGKKEVQKKYPFDIPYNAARLGNFAVCCIKYTDEVLIDNLIEKNIKIIDTKQGYSKCSICIVNEKAVITSDRGISNLLNKNDIDCLVITPGYISLFELNYGFIGGSTGRVSKEELAFLGSINNHPNNIEIKNFLLKHGKIGIELSENLLIDLGTLIPLKEYSIMKY